MEMVLNNGYFSELCEEDLFKLEGEGALAAVTMEAVVFLGGSALIAFTPFKSAGVKIIVEGSIAAAGLYFA